MPHYAFRAADQQGSMSRGALEAAHEDDLYATLHKRGLLLIDCRKKEGGYALLSRNIPLKEQVLFCRHMLALTKAGVPVHLALKDVTEISKNRALRASLNEIYAAVMNGASLPAAFGIQGKRFDMLFVLLLQAGERTGRLNEALNHLHDALAWKESYAATLKRMAVYPLVQITLASIATVVLMLVAVPQIIDLLGFLNQQLPWYSDFLLACVRLIGLGGAGLALFGILGALFLPVLRLTGKPAAVFIDGAYLRLPIIGPLLMKQSLARLSQLFAAMLASGVSMSDALASLPQLTHNQALARDLDTVRGHVATGQGFSAAFERGMQLPGYMVRLLKVGEDGGELGQSLTHIARLYQQESEQALEAILRGSSLGVTVIVGFVLAAIVIGVFYPLYNGLGSVVGG